MIAVGGENLIDFIQETGDGGHPLYRAIPGGSPFNTAKAIARQGQDVGYLTPFSSDTLGRLLQGNLLENAGVAALAPNSPKPTSLAVVSFEDGQPRYQFYREDTAERDITLERLQASLPDDLRAFYVGSLALAHGADADAWADLFVALAARGVFTTLDPNIRAAFIHDRAGYLARLERLIGCASLIKLSDEDIGWLNPDDDMIDAAQAIFDRSPAPLVVLTKGAEGAVGFCADGRIDVDPVPVPDLKDTVGAGDTFMGTLIAQTARRGLMTRDGFAEAGTEEMRAIMETAARAAAINCGRVGCNPPTLADLDLQASSSASQ